MYPEQVKLWKDLYLISDLFIRNIVAWEVWEKESAATSRSIVSNENPYVESILKILKY